MTVSNQVPNNQEMVVYQAWVDHELVSQHDFEIHVELFCTLLDHAVHFDLVSNNVWCVKNEANTVLRVIRTHAISFLERNVGNGRIQHRTTLNLIDVTFK